MELINIGVIQKPHGVRGEVKVFPRTDFEKERFKVGNKVLLKLNQTEKWYTIKTSRKHQGSILIQFEGLETLNDVEFFHKGELFVEKDSLHTLPKNQYYFVDLQGCDVYLDGNKIGVVSEVMDNPAHPILRVETAERDILVPFVDRFVGDVSIEKKSIEIFWMEGL